VRKIDLTCEPTAYANLHEADQGRGVKGTVNKADLKALLVDHGRLHAALEADGTVFFETWKD